MKQIKARYLMIPLMFIKAFFSAVTQVAWGLGGLMLLQVLMVYLIREELPTTLDESFVAIQSFIFNHMMFFVWVFFGVYLYFEVREIIKKEEKK